MADVLIVSTGTANVASVCAAFKRLGAPPTFCEAPEQIGSATHVILPGVGTFGAAMAELKRRGFDEPLRQRLAARRPTLCVCVGLQVLAKTSEESPGATGLGVLDTEVTAFPKTVRVPQFGWNRVITPAATREPLPSADNTAGNELLPTTPPTNSRSNEIRGNDTRPNNIRLDSHFAIDEGYAYFANSFRMTQLPDGWSFATAEHGGPFIAAIQSGGVLGCQFHPELSGKWGQALLGRWLAQEDAAC